MNFFINQTTQYFFQKLMAMIYKLSRRRCDEIPLGI